MGRRGEESEVGSLMGRERGGGVIDGKEGVREDTNDKGKEEEENGHHNGRVPLRMIHLVLYFGLFRFLCPIHPGQRLADVGKYVALYQE